MITTFKFGESMEKGKAQYRSGLFAEAKVSFENALQKDPDDFEGNLWLARALIRSGENQYAQEVLTRCSAVRPDLQKAVVDDWISVAESGDENNRDLLETTTDERLEKLHVEKNIRFRDVGQFILVFVALSLLMGILRKAFSLELSISSRIIIEDVIWIAILSAMLYSRMALRDNIRGFLSERIKLLKELFVSQYREIWYSLLYLNVIAVALIPKQQIIEDYLDEIHWHTLLLPGPVEINTMFAMIFCIGLLFNFLRRHNRALAYIVSAIMFCGLLWPLVGVLVVFKFCVYVFLYEKCNSLSIIVLLFRVDTFTLIVAFIIKLIN